MNEFEKLLEKSLSEEVKLYKGKVVRGNVVKVTDRYIFVDIGFKIEGVIPKEELPDAKEGQEIEAVVVKFSPRIENPLLSYQLIAQQKGLEKIRKAYAEGKVLNAAVEKKTKGGYIVDIEGVKAFMPFEETGRKVSEGKQVRVKVLNIVVQKGKAKITVSQKAYLDEEKERRKAELLKQIKSGDVVEGKVIKIDQNKGITLLIEGVVRAFLPKEELSWGRDRNPFHYAEIGETMKVKVDRLSKDKSFLFVSYRKLKGDPWQSADQKYKVGSTVEGKVVGLTPKGAWVEIEEGVEGFIPKEEVSWEGDKELNKGDTVKAKVINLDIPKRRIILSIKQALPKPWEEFIKENPAGSKVRGKVEKIEKGKAIVSLGDKVRGVIYRRDLSWTKPSPIEEVLKEGEEREFAVIGLDGNFVKLSIKHLTPNPWEVISQKYKVGDVIKLRVKDVMSFGAFLELPEGVDGLLPYSEKPRDMKLEKGQEVEVKIIDLNPAEKKLTFSINALLGKEEEEESFIVTNDTGAGFKLSEILKKKWKT